MVNAPAKHPAQRAILDIIAAVPSETSIAAVIAEKIVEQMKTAPKQANTADATAVMFAFFCFISKGVRIKKLLFNVIL
jgi:hypothetical protein